MVIVENVLDELEHSDFRPVAFELGFGGKNGQLPAVTVTAGDTTLSVTGKVDRVDGWLKNGKLYLRVVDYKTGKKAFDLADVRYGLGIQMLLYLFALQRYGGDYFGAAVEPAGVLYLPARDVVKKADRAIAPDKLAALLRGELRRTGMVLSDPEVLTAMEHSALESPCYLPIAVKKDGSVSGLAASVLADAAQMGKMGRYVDELLRKVAGSWAMAILTQIHAAGGLRKVPATGVPSRRPAGLTRNGISPIICKRPRRKNSGSWWTRR